jgi:hypothetical protein
VWLGYRACFGSRRSANPVTSDKAERYSAFIFKSNVLRFIPFSKTTVYVLARLYRHLRLIKDLQQEPKIGKSFILELFDQKSLAIAREQEIKVK